MGESKERLKDELIALAVETLATVTGSEFWQDIVETIPFIILIRCKIDAMQFLDQHILLALIALPMVGAAVIMAIPGAHDNSVRRVATAFGLVVMLLSFYLFARYYFDGDGARFANTWRWLRTARSVEASATSAYR